MNVILERFLPLVETPRWQRDEGQDMVEYALLVGLLSVFALAIIILVGPSVKDTFQYIVNQLGTA